MLLGGAQMRSRVVPPGFEVCPFFTRSQQPGEEVKGSRETVLIWDGDGQRRTHVKQAGEAEEREFLTFYIASSSRRSQGIS